MTPDEPVEQLSQQIDALLQTIELLGCMRQDWEARTKASVLLAQLHLAMGRLHMAQITSEGRPAELAESPDEHADDLSKAVAEMKAALTRMTDGFNDLSRGTGIQP